MAGILTNSTEILSNPVKLEMLQERGAVVVLNRGLGMERKH